MRESKDESHHKGSQPFRIDPEAFVRAFDETHEMNAQYGKQAVTPEKTAQSDADKLPHRGSSD